jgi:amidohydrolase
MDILEIAESQKDQVYEIFEFLHRNPEKSWEEFKTSEYIKNKLSEAGYEVTPNVNNTTGIIAVLMGEEAGIVYSVRADMDALVFNVDGEDKAVHACGHDANRQWRYQLHWQLPKKG